ncbi:hypothetical protein [Planomicrobium soli]|nr:hypothetical protein [Planomicrobium soli]
MGLFLGLIGGSLFFLRFSNWIKQKLSQFIFWWQSSAVWSLSASG